MSQFSFSFRTLQNASGVANNIMCELIPSATDFVSIFEIDLLAYNINAVSATEVGLGMSSSVGVPKSNSFVVLSDYFGEKDVPSLKVATDWNTLPGYPSNLLRRVMLSGVNLAAQTILKFQKGLKLTPSSSLVITNPNAIGGNQPNIFDINISLS